MARPPNTDERRAQIVSGLIEVMAQRGYDGASVVEIARAAGITPGLVHYHFRNKQAILLASLDALAEAHGERIDAALAGAGPSPSAQLAAFIDANVGLGASADPASLATWILIGGEALRDAAVRVHYGRALASLHQRLRAIVEEGVHDGSFSCADADEAAAALLAAMQGAFTLAATADLLPRGSAARSLKKMARGLLEVSR